jgi:heat shock protein HtpX
MSGLLDPEAELRHRQRNLWHTVALVGGIGLVGALCAGLLFGWTGIILAALAVLAVVTLAPRLPPEAVMRMYNARRLDDRIAGQLGDLIAALTERAGLPTRPTLYVIPSMTLNAFATGHREQAAIGITEGLLRKLSLREIAGVIAHEVSHIRNNDLAVMGLADAMTRLTQAMSYVALALALMNVLAMLVGDPTIPWAAIVLLYLAPAISSLLQLALSRAREYDADREAAALTGDPAGLAAALRRLERHTGHLWQDLVYPVPGRRIPQPSVLRSHPSTSDRIARLLEMQSRPQLQPRIVLAEGPMISLVGVGPLEMRARFRFPGVWF